MAGFTVAPGTYSAFQDRNDNRAYFTFQGDLNQLGIIYIALLGAGFPVVKSNVYPGFIESQEDEYKLALEHVFTFRIPGWWNQKDALLKYEICTLEEYKAALDAQVD